jgi:hypothetical protein
MHTWLWSFVLSWICSALTERCCARHRFCPPLEPRSHVGADMGERPEILLYAGKGGQGGRTRQG